MPHEIPHVDMRDPSSPSNVLPRRSWTNWTLLAMMFVATTVGLSAIVAILLPERLVSPWPWVRTDVALLAACVTLVVMFVLHISRDQRRIDRLHARYTKQQRELTEDTSRRLYALLEVSQVMGQQSDPQDIFDCITRSCVATFRCDQSSLMLFDPQRGKLVVRSANGHVDVSKIIGREQDVGAGIAGWAATNKQAIILGKAGSNPRDLDVRFAYPSLTAAIVAPIILRDELVGVLNISSRSAGTIYTDDDLRSLKVFAENAGTCIRNAERAEWMRQTIDSLQQQLARANEVRTASLQPDSRG
ncbi:MAG TPA: GAF domain-containing protein [Candidatus Krumholzibacteria bacterium]|nr:GAF domain-containing protein [Candidatus Krumholzibacteria bacterium]